MKKLKDKKALQLLVILAVLLVNYWTWRILFLDPIILIILSLLTFSLHNAFTDGTHVKKVILLFIIASFLILRVGFDTNFKSARTDIKLNQRHNYYYEYFGKLYANRISTYAYNNVLPIWYRFEKNAFSALDLNLYFFNSHPRERAEVEEFKKYSFLLLPFFLVGFISLIQKGLKVVLVYIAVATLISGFVATSYKLGPVLFFPLLNICIAYGATIFFQRLKYES